MGTENISIPTEKTPAKIETNFSQFTAIKSEIGNVDKIEENSNLQKTNKNVEVSTIEENEKKGQPTSSNVTSSVNNDSAKIATKSAKTTTMLFNDDSDSDDLFGPPPIPDTIKTNKSDAEIDAIFG